MTDNIVNKVRELEGRIVLISSDLYGDELRQKSGIVQDFRGITSALNRLAIVLVFFALISLLNLITIVWVVLSL